MTLDRIKLMEFNCSKIVEVFTFPFQNDVLFCISLTLIIFYCYITRYMVTTRILFLLVMILKQKLTGFSKHPRKIHCFSSESDFIIMLHG